MLERISKNKELKEIAKIELVFMRLFNLSYSELQDMPVYVLNIWLQEHNEQLKKQEIKKWQKQSSRRGSN